MKNTYDSTISESPTSSSSLTSSTKLNNININDLDDNFKKINISLNDLILNNIYNSSKSLDIVGKYDLIYLFRETKKDIYLVGFLNMPTRSYYKVKSNDDIYKLNYYYKSREIKEHYNSNIYFYLDINLKYENLIRYFLNNSSFSDIISYYYKINNKTNMDNITLSDEIYTIMKESDEINIYTNYSKSLIKIYNCDNRYICQISYDKIEYNNRYDIIEDMPSDIDVLLLDFKLININDINYLQKNINNKLIDLLNTKNHFILTKLYEIDKTNEYLNCSIQNTNLIKELSEVGTFKAFENSVDILINTIYEQIPNTQNKSITQYNQINKLIYDKINNIILWSKITKYLLEFVDLDL